MGLAGAVWAALPYQDFTLAWNHTVEHIRWEEDYRVTENGLLLGEARIKGTGAGMEIPDGAVLRDGSWHYLNDVPPLQPLHLARTPQAGDYWLCHQSACRELSAWLGPPNADRPAVALWGCQLP